MLSKKYRTRPILIFSYHYLTLSLSNQPELIWGDESERIHPHHHYYPIPDTKFLRYYIYLFTAVCLFALLYVPTYNIIPVTYVCINLKSLDHTQKILIIFCSYSVICKSKIHKNHKKGKHTSNFPVQN